MQTFFHGIFWCLVLLLILVGIDQLMVRVPMSQPALHAVREFYLDFRARLLHQLPGRPTSIESIIEQDETTAVKAPAPRPKAATTKPKKVQKKAAPASAAQEPQYFYADAAGELHFVNSLQEVPQRYRPEAQRLAR